MRDDEEEAEREVNTVPTVPPPPGEDDVYDAKTQVGGLTAEALAMLRQFRDERVPAGLHEEANVPVFEDEDNSPGPIPRVVPAAGKPAVAKVAVPASSGPVLPVSALAPRASSPPVAPRGPASRPSNPAVAPSGPASRPSHPGLAGQGITAQVARSGAAIKAAFSTPPVPAVTPKVPSVAETASAATPSVRLATETLTEMTETPTAGPTVARPSAMQTAMQAPRLPEFDGDEPDPDEPPPSYVAVFGPMSGDAVPAASLPRRRSRGLLIVTTLILVALAVVLMGEAGWITGFIPGRSPNAPPAVQP
jgi:hypothetical protein